MAALILYLLRHQKRWLKRSARSMRRADDPTWHVARVAGEGCRRGLQGWLVSCMDARGGALPTPGWLGFGSRLG